jgi:hypothetical protein
MKEGRYKGRKGDVKEGSTIRKKEGRKDCTKEGRFKGKRDYVKERR